MKGKSIVLCAVSFGLILIGTVGCAVGLAPSYSGKMNLFKDVSICEYGYMRTYEIKNTDISRVLFDVSDADVEIITGQDRERIEIVNFPEHSYAYRTDNKTLCFDDTDVPGGVWARIFDYEGLREYINYIKYSDEPQKIILYLGSDKNIETVDVKLGSGELFIDGDKKDSPFYASFENGEFKVK